MARFQCDTMRLYAEEKGVKYTSFTQLYFTSPSDYKVDWESSPIGTECTVITPHFACKHTVGLNLTSNVCCKLIGARHEVKAKMRATKSSSKYLKNDKELESKLRVQELLQWALKIAANALYGCLAFREYNTYSPRCGISVTCIGNCALWRHGQRNVHNREVEYGRQCELETRKKHGTFKAISSLSAIKLMAGIKVCSGASARLKPKLDP